jgi:hypothetical protein
MSPGKNLLSVGQAITFNRTLAVKAGLPVMSPSAGCGHGPRESTDARKNLLVRDQRRLRQTGLGLSTTFLRAPCPGTSRPADDGTDPEPSVPTSSCVSLLQFFKLRLELRQLDDARGSSGHRFGCWPRPLGQVPALALRAGHGAGSNWRAAHAQPRTFRQ